MTLPFAFSSFPYPLDLKDGGTGTSIPTIGAAGQVLIVDPTGTFVEFGTVYAGSINATDPIVYNVGTNTLSYDFGYAGTYTIGQTLSRSALTTTIYSGYSLINPTLATNASRQQYSPALLWQGQGWNSLTNTSDKIQVRAYVSTSTIGVAAPIGVFNLDAVVGFASPVNILAIDTTGRVTFPNIVTTNSQLLINGAFTANSIGSFNGPVTFYSTFLAGGGQFQGSLTVNNNLVVDNQNFYYHDSNHTLALGLSSGDPGEATLHTQSSIAETAPPVPSVNATLNNAQQPTDIMVASASQTSPLLGVPQSLSAFQDSGGSYYIANGSTYMISVWSFDGTNFSVIPATTSFTDDNSGNPFQINMNWAPPGFGSSVAYMVGLSINSAPTLYLNVGNVTNYVDNSGNYPDSAPTPLSPDYVANGTTRNYLAYNSYLTPDMIPYFSVNGYSYSMTDDNSGLPYQVSQSITPGSGSGIRVIGSPDGISANDHIDSGSFIENASTWVAGNAVTPNTFGYQANGSTLNLTYNVYSSAVINGVNVFNPTPGTTSTTDPNDGSYYYVTVGIGGSINSTTLRSGSMSGAHVGTSTAIYDYSSAEWMDSGTITPTGYLKPAGLFEKDTASFTDTPTVVIRSLDASTPTPYIDFQKSDKSSLAKLGVTPSGTLQTAAPVIGASFNGFLANSNISQFTNNSGYITNSSGSFVNNVSNATLTRSGSGPYTLGLNLSNANSWAAKQTLAASTTSAAGLNIPTGPSPTTPVDGDLWSDNTQKSLTFYQNGLKKNLSSTIFAATAFKTITNTTTETSLVGTGIGTMTLPANFLSPGTVIVLTFGGIFSTPISPGNITVKVKYGTTPLSMGVITNLMTSASGAAFQGTATITIWSIGSSAQVLTDGSFNYDISSAGARDFVALNLVSGVPGILQTINTTSSTLLDVTVTYAAASSSNIMKVTNFRAEVLN